LNASYARPEKLNRLFAVLLLFVEAVSSSWAETGTADDPPKFVVALFRHGIRSPTPDFANAKANVCSKDPWPSLTDWNVMVPVVPPGECDPGKGWGYLTNHGRDVVQGLGEYYGDHYKRTAWPKKDFNVYLWADAANQRTRETAKALAAGFKKFTAPDRVTVAFATTDPSPCPLDPLFHPFTSKCGKVKGNEFQNFADEINAHEKDFHDKFAPEFQKLSNILKYPTEGPTPSCTPVTKLTDNAITCLDPSTCGSPLQWKERFAYASSASEAFLLEYANKMEVGWGGVDVEKGDLRELLKLHEFYFDKTDRYLRKNGQVDDALVNVDGSNLSREILDQLLRKAQLEPLGKCPRANADSDFVGLVGHDTNLASVGALLDLHWQFNDPNLPKDTRDLPADDALPAGALVFELRERDGTDYVRVQYVTQSLEQMLHGPKSEAFRLEVTGTACQGKEPCEMTLTTFRQLVYKRIKDSLFLSGCSRDGGQICPPP
jgi:4-phytase/acid phosphatase